MTLNQMQYFEAICRYENFTKAANALYISQPTISQAMRDLENECGVPLITRKGNGLVITEAGQVLLAEIRQILQQTQNLQKMIETIGLTRNYVRIGLSTFSGNQVFPGICRAFHEKYPDIQIITEESDTPTLLQLLEVDRLDVVLTSPGDRKNAMAKEYNFYELKRSGLRYAVSRDSPLAKKGSTTLAEIAAHPLVLLSPKYNSGRMLMKQFEKHGLNPQVIATTTQMYTVERFVECGAAGGFLPEDITRFNPNIVVLDYPEARPLQCVSLVWKKKELLFPAVEKFIQLTREMYPRG